MVKPLTICALLLLAITCEGQEYFRRRTPLPASATTPDVGVPYAWWKMTGTDTNATQLLDTQGNVNVSNKPNVATGPTMITTNGSFYYFSGAPTYFRSAAVSASAFGPTSMAATAWVFLTNSPATSSGFAILNNFSTSRFPLIWRSSEGPTYSLTAFRGKQCVFIGNNDSSKYIGRASATSIPLTNWVMLGFVWNGGTTTSSISMYVNGELDNGAGNAAGAFAGMDAITDAINIGAEAAAANQNVFTGYYDDIRYFTNILTATQISNIYNAGRQ